MWAHILLAEKLHLVVQSWEAFALDCFVLL